MNILERLTQRTHEQDHAILTDVLESAKYAILSRRFPYSAWPVDDNGEYVLEPKYIDLQYRIALDMYNKLNAEGQLTHSENGVARTYESSWISDQLLCEVTPMVGVVK